MTLSHNLKSIYSNTDILSMKSSSKNLEDAGGDSIWTGVAKDSTCNPLKKNASEVR